MAMFHFRLKSDKKPDGTIISAVQHVDYINREGNFSDKEHLTPNDNFSGNFISIAETPIMLGGQNVLLYRTADFGAIRNTEKGIEISEDASPITIAIALTLAKEKLKNQPLIVYGSDKFKKELVETALKAKLPISFEDNFLQAEYEKEKERNNLEKIFSSDQNDLVNQTVNQILERIRKSQTQVDTSAHVEYINREKAYAERGDCIFHFHHLPKWAKDDLKKFFQAADKYEGANNRRYMEIEFALPNELKTIEQYRQIIDAFIEKHLKNHYYTYAIHDKIGLMSEGQRHPHVHIMFSERMIDEVEKLKERNAKAFFLYPARKKKDGSEPSFEERWKRGAPKNRKWSEKNFLKELRADFAQIQNEVLERN